jgi:hypothetical protein
MRISFPLFLGVHRSPLVNIKAASILLAGLGGFSTSGVSAQSDSLMVDVGPCVLLESAIARFACYENQVELTLTGAGVNYQAAPASVPQQSNAGSAAAAAVPLAATAAAGSAATTASVSTTTTAPTTTQNSTASFGLPETRVVEEDDEEVLYSSIAELSETVPNSHLITLSNGQVWRQVRPDSRYRMKVGHEVRIYPSRWGKDYRLSVEELRGFIQVERIN